MKIVSWNCAGAFRKKADVIFALNADVYCLQECEAPEKHTQIFKDILDDKRIIWKGNDPKKDRGVAIIAKSGIGIERLDWSGDELRDFLPVIVRNDVSEFAFVNVWACHPYIENFNAWLDICQDKINASTVLMGDFNSNKIWDAKHGVSCHSEALRRLSDRGLFSAYHFVTDEEQGAERTPTFFLYRHDDRPYHLDYAFASPSAIKSFKIANGDWTPYSDHVPIFLELDESKLS